MTFDIDANGIFAVTAKDKGTNKEQKIVITSDSKLSEEEIQKMVKEGEANSEKDKAIKDRMEAHNNLDSMLYQAEKMLKENADKIPADMKSDLEKSVEEAKTKLSSQDVAVLKKAKEDFEVKMHKLSEHIYKNGAAGANPGAANSSKSDEDVVEAEFSDDEDQKKKA